MSYKNVDKDRLGFLFSHAFEVRKLKEFLTKNKKALILCGVRLDNIPNNYERGLKVIVSLPERANHLLERWLEKTLAEHQSARLVEELIDDFRQHETSEVDWNKDELTDSSKSVLRSLIREDCPKELLEFLRTPIGESTNRNGNKGQPQSIEDEQTVCEGDDKVQKLISMVLEDEAPDTGGYLSQQAILLKIIIAVKSGRIGEAKELYERLDDGGDQRGVAKNIISQAESIEENPPNRNCGIVMLGPTDELDIDDLIPEDLAVLGVCRRIVPGKPGQNVHFVEPIGVLNQEGFHVLGQSSLERLFPDVGRLIAYSDSAHFKLPGEDEFGLWRWTKFETSRDIKCRLHDIVNEVYCVERIPFESTQYESVKNWIKTYKKGANKPLFCLKDNIIIKPHVNIIDYTMADFDEPFDAWSSLPAIKWGDLFLVVQRLPATEMKYDCSDTSMLAKKLLKLDLQLFDIPKLKASQVKDLIAFMKSGQFQASAKQIERLEVELNKYADIRDGLSQIVELIVNRPDIKDAIETEKRKAVQEMVEQQVKLKSMIENLRAEKTKIEEQIAKESKTLKQLPNTISKNIAQAFEEARKHGEKVLGELALFKCLMKDSPPNPNMASDKHPICGVTFRQPSGMPLIEALGRTGLPRVTSRVFSGFVPSIIKAGFIPVFKGRFSSLIAEEIVRSLAQTRAMIIDIPVGLVSSGIFKDLVAPHADIDTVLIRNANLSPLESYGPELCEIAEKCLVNHDEKPNVAMLMTLSNNTFAFDIPNDFSWNCAMIDLNARMAPGSDYDIEEAASELIESLGITNAAWIRALGRLEKEISVIASNDRTDIKSAVKVYILDAVAKLKEHGTGESR